MTSAAIPSTRLPDVVLGNDREFSRPQGMAELASSERPDREALLAQVLENPREVRRHKAAAAVALGRVATPLAEQTLLRNLVDTADSALQEVLLSLGRIGGPGAIAAIDAVRLAPRHPAARTAAYAAALIAHRFGLPGHELPLPAAGDLLPLPAGQTRPIEFGPAESTDPREVLESMKGQPYGIEFDAAALTWVRCAGEVNVICPNREFLGPAVRELQKRPAIPALVALQSPETGEHSVSYVVFSRPAGVDEVALTVHRCTGKLALAGGARITGSRLHFELGSVRHPGAWAVLLRGSLEDGRFQVTEGIGSTTPEKRRMPTQQHR